MARYHSLQCGGGLLSGCCNALVPHVLHSTTEPVVSRCGNCIVGLARGGAVQAIKSKRIAADPAWVDSAHPQYIIYTSGA